VGLNVRRLRLLPPGSPLGWTPYGWLLYLPTFLIEPIARTQAGPASVFYWAVTIAGLLIFLASYFRAYWVRGVQLLPIVALQTALALAFAPINMGACVLFVYAAATAGNIDRARDALRMVLGIAALGAASAWLLQAEPFYWVTAIPITLLIGGVNLHFTQESRTQRKLRLAQEEVEQLAAVAERERIARDLHDVLGHTLSLIVLKSELAARLAERDPARAAGEMRDVEDVARRTLQEVREAIRGYHPTLAEEAARARSMLKAADIAADVDLAAASLSGPIEETLALALREAVTNVVRHSGASRCSIALAATDRAVTLDVADDGRGSSAAEGSGLRGMRERVEALGGSVDRHAGGGMRVRVVLPTTLPGGAPVDDALRDVAG
jgi:two-component system sensor histidine kinase DesK